MGMVDLGKYIVQFISATQAIFFVMYSDKVLQKSLISPAVKFILSVSLVILNCYPLMYLYKYGRWLPSILFIVMCFVFSMICYNNRIIETVVNVFTYYVCTWFVQYLVNYTFDELTEYFNLNKVIIGDYLSSCVGMILMYVFAVLVVPKFVSYKERNMSAQEAISLLVFCISGFLILINTYSMLAIICAGLCTIVIIMLASYMNTMAIQKEQIQLANERVSVLEREEALLKDVNQAKYKSYQKSREAEDKIRKINHDLNHHFNYLLAYGDLSEKAKNYILELKGNVNECAKYFETGDGMVDLILEEYKAKAEKNGISFGFVGGFDENGLDVEASAISVILGNLLNNAIEGALRSEAEYKCIDMNLYKIEDKELFIKIVNTANTKVININNGLIETSKEDKEDHGIGMRSVRQMVESCLGRMKISAKDNIFDVEIHLPLKKQRQYS